MTKGLNDEMREFEHDNLNPQNDAPNPENEWDNRKDEEESFAETVQKGGGILSYDLIYQMEGSKLFVSISEYNMYGDYSVEYISVCYCTDDLYVYLRDETNSGALVQEEDVYPFE